jgi:uncharacterized RDD family membrane protein YckC
MASNDDDRIDMDLELRPADAGFSGLPDWPDAVDSMLGNLEPDLQIEDPLPEPAPESFRSEPEFDIEPPIDPPPLEEVEPDEQRAALPLFMPAFGGDDDEPLIKLPAAPRPPLSVRRAPDTPRLRAVPKVARAAAAEPALEFEDTAPVGADLKVGPYTSRNTDEEVVPSIRPTVPLVSRVWAERAPAASEPAGGPGARVAAGVVDHLLLAGVDAIVIYFTARIAGLAMSEWTALPPAPLFVFLVLLKLAYFSAFTAVGGQTIGKMALRIRVVAADGSPVDAALAMKRTFAGALSAMCLGLGYIPAFFDADRRALHDRMSRTRVITLSSA